MGSPADELRIFSQVTLCAILPNLFVPRKIYFEHTVK